MFRFYPSYSSFNFSRCKHFFSQAASLQIDIIINFFAGCSQEMHKYFRIQNLPSWALSGGKLLPIYFLLIVIFYPKYF